MDTESGISDEAYQDQILPHVSRTFALTIPQLPQGLRVPVTNAYLLCRIADTIEDEPAISPQETLVYLKRFADVVAGKEPAAPLAEELAPRFSERSLPAERELAGNMERVIRMVAGFRTAQRTAIRRCLELMCHGMPQFQHNATVRGLPRLTDTDSYCYYVAGVVGEMLTELFCDYSPVIAQRRAGLSELAVSFAQGLQMTNILKDVWEDRSRGACWLPQEVFSRHGVDLSNLTPEHAGAGFSEGMLELVGVAHRHLRNALSYTLLIPGNEAGIRRFCLWAIGLAVLTLRKIQENPGFTSGAQVKVSRRAVMATRILTQVAVRNDWLLRRLFATAAAGLPLAATGAVHRPARVAPSSHAPTSMTEYGRQALRSHVGSAGRHSDGSSMQ